MENSGTAKVVSMDSLLNLPPMEGAKEGSKEELLDELTKKKEEVLPGLNVDPIEPITKEGEDDDDIVIEETPPVVENEEDDDIVPGIKDDETYVEPETSIKFKESLKKLFGDKLGSLVQDIDGEEQEVALEDLEIDEDTFELIVKSKLDEAREEAAKDKVSVEGVSDFTKKLIELDKNGGDVRELLEIKEAYTDPLEGLDLENVDHQKEIIFLRGHASGQNEKDIARLIKSYEEEGVLETMATEANTILRNAIDAKLNEKLEASRTKKEQEVERFKQYKKDFKENLNQFELNDKVKGKLYETATKVDKDGKYALDDLYNEWRLDPEKAAKLALMFLDENEFISQVSKKAVKSKQLETARKIKIIPKADKVVSPTQTKKQGRSVNISQIEQ